MVIELLKPISGIFIITTFVIPTDNFLRCDVFGKLSPCVPLVDWNMARTTSALVQRTHPSGFFLLDWYLFYVGLLSVSFVCLTSLETED